MERVYMVQQEDCSHVDSIWDDKCKAAKRKVELNQDAICGGYTVVEVALNKILEDES